MAEEELSAEEAKERKIMKLLLKVKNGTPPQRKSALRQLSDKARDFGAGPLFNQILPLLMSPTLEDQERHLLVKVSKTFPLAKHVAVQLASVFPVLRGTDSTHVLLAPSTLLASGFQSSSLCVDHCWEPSSLRAQCVSLAHRLSCFAGH